MGLGAIQEVSLFNSKGMTVSLNNPGARQTGALVSQACSDTRSSTCSVCASRISIYLVLRVGLGSPQKANASMVTCTCCSVMEQERESSSSYTSHGDSAASSCRQWQGREGAEAIKTTGRQPVSPKIVRYLVALLWQRVQKCFIFALLCFFS